MRHSKLGRLLFLSALLLTASAAAAPAAQAWTTNGPLAFTATAPTAVFRINTPAPFGVTCSGVVVPGNRALGTLNALSGSPSSLLVGNLQLSFTACSAGPSAAVTCTPATVHGVSYAAPVVSVEVRGLSCSVPFPSLPQCVISIVSTGPSGRAFSAQYDNTLKRLTVLATGQTMSATWPAQCTLFPPSPGPATLTNAVSGNLQYTVTGSPAPVITNP